MKFLIPLLLAVSSSFAATEFDLRKGIDLTGATNVTASQLNQLVDSGLIASTNKGGIIRRSGNGGGYWPDVTANPRYTNFLWVDLFTSTLKTYVPIGDGYTNWVAVGAAATVANGSITSAQLAANSVQTTNIADSAVTTAKINAGAVGNAQLASGAVSNINIADLTIQSGKLAYGAVLSTNIAAGQLLPIHFTTGSVNSNALADASVTSNKVAVWAIGATNIQNLTITSNQIANGTINSNQIAAGTLNYGSLDTNASYGLFRAYALIDSSGNLLRGFNVTSVGMVGVNDYFFTLTVGTADTNRLIFITPYSPIGAPYFARTTTNTSTGRVAVRVTDSGGVAQSATVAIGVLTY